MSQIALPGPICAVLVIVEVVLCSYVILVCVRHIRKGEKVANCLWLLGFVLAIALSVLAGPLSPILGLTYGTGDLLLFESRRLLFLLGICLLLKYIESGSARTVWSRTAFALSVALLVGFCIRGILILYHIAAGRTLLSEGIFLLGVCAVGVGIAFHYIYIRRRRSA